MRIPLYGSYTERQYRGVALKDQRFVNCWPEVIKNPVSDRMTVYVHKRDGFGSATSCSGIAGRLHISRLRDQLSSVYTGRKSTALGTTVTFQKHGVTLDTTACDATSGALFFAETVINNELLIVTAVVAGSVRLYWFYGENAGSGSSVNFTGDLTNLSAVVPGISSTTGIYVGQLLTHASIPALTRVASVDSATQITMTAAATGTAAAATIARSVLALIQDADFLALSTVGEPAFLDGSMYVMDTQGRVWGSDLNSITSFGSINFVTTDAIADYGAGVIMQGSYMIAFGLNGYEVLQNVGGPAGSPLQRIPSAAGSVGRKLPEADTFPQSTALNVEGVVYWISPQRELWRMNGLAPIKISPHGIDRLQVLSIRGYFRRYGQLCIMLDRDNPYGTFAYFPETNLWSEWKFGSGASRFGDFAQDSNGSVYTTDSGSTEFVGSVPDTYQDDGTNPETLIQIGPFDNDTRKRKFWESFELIGDKRGTSGNTAIQFSDDDGQTWSTARNVDMSTDRPRLVRCGSTRRRMVRITDSVNAALRLQAMEIEDEGGSL